MAAVAARDIVKTFGALRALDGVSIDFADGGFYGLLGPSGSGKTTLLRLIAGFEFPDGGEITIGGAPVHRLPTQKRDIGMMFQSYALFPNMSVFDNVAFGLKVRGVARREIRTRVGDALALVQLSGLEQRRPHQLSGGQRQRVALARATVIRPRVLLLDEPLSALDKALRTGMQVELKRIQREIGITTIFVTHDQEEALALSDKIGVLRDGHLVQEGSPREIYDRPATEFAATFLGEANIFRGTGTRTSDGEGGRGAVRLQSGALLRMAGAGAGEGAPVSVAVRPERMRILPPDAPGDPAQNILEATVMEVIFAGNSLTAIARHGDGTLKVFAQNTGAPSPPAGSAVRLAFSPADTIPVAP